MNSDTIAKTVASHTDWTTVILITIAVVVLVGLILFVNWLTGKSARERGEKRPRYRRRHNDK